MRHQQQHAPIDKPQGFSAVFSIFNAVLFDDGPRIRKHAGRRFKTDPVLVEIAGCLGFISFKIPFHPQIVSQICIYACNPSG